MQIAGFDPIPARPPVPTCLLTFTGIAVAGAWSPRLKRGDVFMPCPDCSALVTCDRFDLETPGEPTRTAFAARCTCGRVVVARTRATQESA